MLKWMWKSALLGLCVLALSGCGEDRTQGVPTPPPPNTGDPGNFNPPPPPSLDERIPQAIQDGRAFPIDLTHPNLQGLMEIAGASGDVVVPPLVGDPLIVQEISDGRSQVVTGKIIVAFEDDAGLWGAELSSFEQTGIRTSDTLDMIFADDEVVFRTVATKSGDNLDGTIFYRVRQHGDTACKRVVVTCTPSWYPCNTNVDVNGECRQYMTVGAPRVKQLGTFRAKYSKWVGQ